MMGGAQTHALTDALFFFGKKQPFFYYPRSPPRSTLFWGQEATPGLQQARVRWLVTTRFAQANVASANYN